MKKNIKFRHTGKDVNYNKNSIRQSKMPCKVQGVLSDYFKSDVGLMQGETISPLLFSLYVNDFEINFVKDNCHSLEIQEVSLFF